MCCSVPSCFSLAHLLCHALIGVSSPAVSVFFRLSHVFSSPLLVSVTMLVLFFSLLVSLWIRVIRVLVAHFHSSPFSYPRPFWGLGIGKKGGASWPGHFLFWLRIWERWVISLELSCSPHRNQYFSFNLCFYWSYDIDFSYFSFHRIFVYILLSIFTYTHRNFPTWNSSFSRSGNFHTFHNFHKRLFLIHYCLWQNMIWIVCSKIFWVEWLSFPLFLFVSLPPRRDASFSQLLW